MYVYFILNLHKIYSTDLLLYYKMTKARNIFKNGKLIFFLYFRKQYAVYLLNQHRQLANGKNVCSALFAKVTSIK